VGLFTWPLFKLNEPHVVLLSLTALAVVAPVSPPHWEMLWEGYTILVASLAPALAGARVRKSVTRGATEEEFARWFRGVPPTDA
jgi:hypothetical protein